MALSTPHGTRGWFYESWRSEEPWERYEVPATQCLRISSAFLEDERRTVGQWWYAQEYCCVCSAAETQTFRREDIDAAFREEVDVWAL